MEQERYKILIVDDSLFNQQTLYQILSSDRLDCAGALQPKFTLSVAKTGPEALEKAMNDKPDLILLDIVMPGMNGFEVLSTLKETDSTRDIPVIIITGLNSIEDEERGFALGAVDYVTKPFNKSLVKARIKTHLKIVEQMRLIEQISLIDALTNIPNRRYFDKQMNMEWARAIREQTPISLLMIDVDHFKIFNNTYGHQQGDVVLKTIAHIIKSSPKRPADIAARWGGEEFAVLLPNTSLNGALHIAEIIRKDIENTMIPSISDDTPLNVTASIGIASKTPAINDAVENFIGLADKALYAAKDAGRNKVLSL